MTATSQIAGYTSGNVAEVEAATKALRATLRPEDTGAGALGAFSVAAISGLMAAGLAGGARIYSFRWSDASRFALVKRVVLSVGSDSTAFTGGTCIFNLFRVVSFTVGDTTNSITPTGNQNKLRVTGQGTTLLGKQAINISTTAAISGGTLTTPDTNPLATNVVGIVATAGTIILTPQYPLFEQRPGEHPLLLAQDEGFMIQATVPATGTWKFGVKTDWSEVTAY